MEIKIKFIAHEMARLLLRQVVSILLKCGVTWKEFSNLSKWMYVDVASKEYGIRDRLTNITRVSIMTGIDRKEVKRQRHLVPLENQLQDSKTTDATRLLYAWHHDPDFLSAEGEPRILSLLDGTPGFASLHERYGGDVSLQAMLKELMNSGSIVMEDKERQTLKVLRTYFMPGSMDSEMLLHVGRTLHDHAAALNNNISTEQPKQKVFEGYAAVENVDKKYENEFKEHLKEKGQVFLDEIDAWLDQRQARSETGEAVRLGAGMYAIHSDE